jgi:Zn-dependent protease with chaperone function
MYFWLGGCIALALLLTIYGSLSVVVSAIWSIGALKSRLADRPNVLFAIRMLPAGASLFLVLLVVLPPYLMFEPYETTEHIGLPLAFMAVLTIIGIGVVFYRVARMMTFNRRWIAKRMSGASPVSLEGIRIPAYAIDNEFPLLAVAGVLHPRLFIANSLLTAMSREQITAAVAHEAGHLAVRDNLRRFLMCLLPGPVFTGKAIERRWKAASEKEADSYAAQSGPESALALASALILVGRIAAGAPQAPQAAFPPCVQLLAAGDAAALADRVEHLMALAGQEPGLAPSRRFLPRLAAGLVAAGVVAFWMSPASISGVHECIESLVSILS